MPREPPIVVTGWTVHGSLDDVLTLVALPPMSSIVINFIAEGVVDRDVEVAVVVDGRHFLEEFWTMSIAI